MIKLKDDNDDVVLRELRDDTEFLADATECDSVTGAIASANWKTAKAWQKLANRIGECEVVTIDGSVRGVIWPQQPSKPKAQHPLWGDPSSPGSCT